MLPTLCNFVRIFIDLLHLTYIESIVESERVKVEVAEPEEETRAAQEELRQVKDEIPDQDTDLRQELLAFRKTKIEPVCEDIECSILSDAIISEFINRKPTTKQEFHSLPYSLRTKIVSGQTQYLDEIFEIIEEYVV